MATRVLVIDNYDSFVFNLVQYLGELGAEPIVHRNDALDGRGGPGARRRRRAALARSRPSGGRRHHGGADPRRSRRRGCRCSGSASATRPSATSSAGSVVAAPELMHGKTSWISHDGHGVFAGLPDPLEATRYHSLVVDRGRSARLLHDHRRGGRRHDHGPAPSGPAARGRAVPPRVDPDDGRPRPAGQLPRRLLGALNPAAPWPPTIGGPSGAAGGGRPAGSSSARPSWSGCRACRCGSSPSSRGRPARPRPASGR